MPTVKDIQQVFDESCIEFVDLQDNPLIPIVEQLSDGIFVGFYVDVDAEWVDYEKLGNTPDEALSKAKRVVAG